MTVALLNFTGLVLTCTTSPCTVFNGPGSNLQVSYDPGSKWYNSTFCSVSRFTGSWSEVTRAGSSLVNASLVGIKAVNGPGQRKTLPRSANSIKATKVVKFSNPRATSKTLRWQCAPSNPWLLSLSFVVAGNVNMLQISGASKSSREKGSEVSILEILITE